VSVQNCTAGRLYLVNDWRQLRRWGINEARVPVGTTVRYRDDTLWDRYQAYILAALGLLIVQYYVHAQAFLIDPAVMPLTTLQATAISVVSLSLAARRTQSARLQGFLCGLVLILSAVHNSWDAVTYNVIQRAKEAGSESMGGE